MTPFVVANFKSHKTASDVTTWLKSVPASPHVLVAPSFVHLSLAADLWPSAVCAQDVSPFPPGSYTGAVSAVQLQDLGVTHCLVGHSERRAYFHETSNDVARKASELLSVGITPIICLRSEDLLSDRAALDDHALAAAYFCYEPPSDIGGTTTAPFDDIRAVTTKIQGLFGTHRVMYGGSVTADNLPSLLPLQLAGFIISTASLDPASFTKLVAQLSHV